MALANTTSTFPLEETNANAITNPDGSGHDGNTITDPPVATTSHLLQTLPIKKDQVYVGGLSMGGMATFEIVKRLPGTFAAAFPICGAANPATAPNLLPTSWWIFHGDKDPVVPFHFSSDMAEALKKEGAHVKFTAYPDVAHNSWDSAFAEPGLLPWLFAQKLKSN